jgi:two-component system response regulator
VHILLVEDSPGDVNLTREALLEARVANTLAVARDGEEALDYVHQRGQFVDALRPDLILLDLNLPRVNGREVLSELKAAPELSRIPIVVLTSSGAEEDIVRSYDLHANAYVTKPVGFESFFHALKQIHGFWLEIVRLPSDSSESAPPLS